jgi:Ca2+/Na+ antiporter
VAEEGQKERVDRELIELLNELRVALPGIQILFAFLLVLPFQQGFASVSETDRLIYVVALLASAIASALLIAPSVYHRLNFRHPNKERMLRDSNVLLIAGTYFTAVGIGCSIYLVADVVYGPGAAVLVTVLAMAVYAALWIALPLRRRQDREA